MVKCNYIIGRFSKDIFMYSGIDRCSVIHTKGCIVFYSACDTEIPLLSRYYNYKYLDILDCDMIPLKQVKQDVQKYYINRLQVILKSSVSAKNTITSIGAYTMSVLRYGFGVLRWTQAELQVLDKNIRKVITKANFRHE